MVVELAFSVSPYGPENCALGWVMRILPLPASSVTGLLSDVPRLLSIWMVLVAPPAAIDTVELSAPLVKLICDVDSLDQFGRTLAYVYLEDGTFVNADLVKNGYAMVMTVPPNIKFADEFVKLQQEARENNKGLWGVTNQ